MQIVADVDSLRGKVSNGPSGRNAVQGRVQGTINRFIGLGALQSGSATVDEGSSEGDSVYLDIVVEDLDAIEKLYLTFEFNFSAVAA
jgi:hypothetical protein